MKRKGPIEGSIYWFLRILLGIFFVAAGIGKALDVPGFVEVVRTYEMGLPLWAMWTAAIGTIVLEAGLGLWLLSGRGIVESALVSVFVNAGYFVLLTITLLRGVDVPNCGCFGVFLPRPLGPGTLLEDGVLILFSWGLYVLAKRKYRER